MSSAPVRPLVVLLAAGALACGANPQGASQPAVKPAPVAAEDALGDALPPMVATWEGGSVTSAELLAATQAEESELIAQLRMDRYELRVQTLDELVDTALLVAEAERLGMGSADDLVRSELERRMEPPSEARLREAFAQVSAQVPNLSFEEARPYLEQQVMQAEMGAAFGDYLAELRERAGVEIGLTYPDLPRTDVPVAPTDPTQGPDDAAVTLVEFAEFECPYCGMAAQTVDALMDRYEGQVRFVYKDYTLPGHTRAIPAAQAARCAGEQGAYWAYHDRLFANQDQLGDDALEAHAAALGLDGEAFAACRSSDRHLDDIEASRAAGSALGVEATPTFFVNGIEVAGAQPVEAFTALIDQELAAADDAGR